MSWSVACFCGAVFEAPKTHCPVCNTPVPEVTRGDWKPATASSGLVDLPSDMAQALHARRRPGFG